MAGPKILVLSTWYPTEANTGFGPFVHEQTAALRDHGADVKVLQPLPRTPFPTRYLSRRYREVDERPERETYQDVEVLHTRYTSLPGNRRFEHVGDSMIEGLREGVAGLHERWPFELVNAHTTYPCGYCANAVRDELLPGLKVVHTIHRTSIIDTPRLNAACEALVKRSLQEADATVFVSREGLRIAEELTGGVFRRPPRYITNGVNPKQFQIDDRDADEIRTLRTRYADATNLLFVGALCERKGTWELIEAFRELTTTEPRPLRLLLVGPNLLGRALERRLRSLGIRDRVEIVGPVDHDRVKIWMRAADVFVLPSHSEGIATVLFEALYSGIPGVFTRVGGTEDVIDDGETGLLIPARSAPGLAEALRRLVRDEALRERLSCNGAQRVRERYTWDLNASRNLELFQELLS